MKDWVSFEQIFDKRSYHLLNVVSKTYFRFLDVRYC
jgi:hypothetical protein